MIQKRDNTHFDVLTDYEIANTDAKIIQLELIQTYQYRDGNKSYVFFFLCEIENGKGRRE